MKYLSYDGLQYLYGKILARLNLKVDKTAGKDLSSNDFSTEAKTKLDGIEEGANCYIHPDKHPAAMITLNADNRFVTDEEKTSWDSAVVNKVDKASIVNNYLSNDPTQVASAPLARDLNNRLNLNIHTFRSLGVTDFSDLDAMVDAIPDDSIVQDYLWYYTSKPSWDPGTDAPRWLRIFRRGKSEIHITIWDISHQYNNTRLYGTTWSGWKKQIKEADLVPITSVAVTMLDPRFTLFRNELKANSFEVKGVLAFRTTEAIPAFGWKSIARLSIPAVSSAVGMGVLDGGNGTSKADLSYVLNAGTDDVQFAINADVSGDSYYGIMLNYFR